MPVTAKLSREFYDRFGDKVVDELVGLLNDVDATFRAELRELNEQNFRRFELTLQRRISDVNAKISDLEAELIKWMFLFWLGTVATMVAIGRLIVG